MLNKPFGAPWQPECDLDMLRQRANTLAKIRHFFSRRGVMEVETPVLSLRSVTDPHLDVFTTLWLPGRGTSTTALFLHTSPEFAMKRLLAGGSGPIYQICKAFRNEEKGRQHNPEFSMLEWYRPGFSLTDIIRETLDLIVHLWPERSIDSSKSKPPVSDAVPRTRYDALFEQYTGLHPLDAPLASMTNLANTRGIEGAERLCGEERTLWLDLIFNEIIQPELKRSPLHVVYAYPAILPSLARPSTDDQRWVERAEIFAFGMELANGFDELRDADMQSERFARDQTYRKRHGMPEASPDDRLLAALAAGLPQCAGMALGIDRLLMFLFSLDDIQDTMGFSIHRA